MLRYHPTPTGMAKIKGTITSVDDNVEKLEPYTLLVGS